MDARSFESLAARVAGACELPTVVLGTHLGSLQLEQYTLLTWELPSCPYTRLMRTVLILSLKDQPDIRRTLHPSPDLYV